jgi:hypothetical protein
MYNAAFLRLLFRLRVEPVLRVKNAVRSIPLLALLCLVGILMSPLLAGFEPVGGDPDQMYRPIKTELSRALREWRLPFWSDRFGLGVPLVAESHIAAFYPPNWVFYFLLSPGVAYRLSMWLHYVALAAAAYGCARVLRLSPWGAALAAVGISLCGFQAVHAGHEPFYCVLPYVPLCLLCAELYAASGRLPWLAGLALAWGVQLTLGHFQIQMWTAGLVVLAETWRVFAEGLPRIRVAALVLALAWGAAIACVQLTLTWELTRVTGFVRPAQYLMNYAFPTRHWAQLALPALFLGRGSQAEELYWSQFATTSVEATAYVGVIPLIMAFIGLTASCRRRDHVVDRGLMVWGLVALLGMVLATMPQWWPDGFWGLVQLPGAGWFRAPGRYTLFTCLGLSILAGRGLDDTLTPTQFWGGLILAVGFGMAALVGSLFSVRNPIFQAAMGVESMPLRFGSAALAWIVGLTVIVAWRMGRLGAWAPWGIAAIELAALFYCGPIQWGWAFHLPRESPILDRLAGESGVGLVAGRVPNLPVWAGLAPAYPIMGITPPPPHYLIESANITPPGRNTDLERRWQRRFGVMSRTASGPRKTMSVSPKS